MTMISAIFSIVFACSCQRELLDPVSLVPVQESGFIRLHMENQSNDYDYPSLQTKVEISGSTGAASWTSGDEIAFCITNGSTISYQTETVNTATSEIPYNVPSGYERANYAIYPAASKGSDYTSPTIVYLSSYDLSGKTAETYSPMPMVAVNGSGLLDFYHVGGLLRLKLTEVDEATSKVTVTFDDIANICGTYTVANAGTSDATLFLSSGAGNVITFTGVSVDSGEAWVNIPLPAGASIGTISVKTFNSSSEELQSVDKRIAWASVGRTYGKQFVIDMSASGDGALSGEFSVSSTTKVRFAQGNLQAVIGTGISNYIATASEWKFAENQYDIIGNAPGNTSFAVGTIVDLFCWVGASATYNSYGLTSYPSNSSTYFGNRSGESLKTDWGSIPEVIDSYGEGWRTLSASEWAYLLDTGGRTNAANKRAFATVCGKKGLLILPDDWTLPAGCSFTVTISNFTTNVYDETAWSKMEAVGVVFLPSTAYRNVLSVGSVNDVFYWSSTSASSTNANNIALWADTAYLPGNDPRTRGFAVRLVRNVN